jgi:hypothetical protein
MRNSAAAAAMTVEIERDGSFDLVPDAVRILGEMERDARSDGGRNTAIAPEHLIKSGSNATGAILGYRLSVTACGRGS